METLHYYFNRVEDEVIKAKLFANTYAGHLNIPAYSLEDAIYRAFPWKNTPEGDAYWKNVADSFETIEDKSNFKISTYIDNLCVGKKPKRGRPKKKTV